MGINSAYYDMIFKRKSFHLFRNVGNEKISEKELSDIHKAYSSFESLYPDIKTGIRIVLASKVNFKRDAEYCILIYSENKENYLLNAGFIGEQLDLYLVRQNIGSLWFGIGTPDEKTYCGMDFVIMIAIHKVSDDSKYRKDMFKAKRKPIEEMWKGDTLGVAEIARFSPSACNTQPWYVENKDGILTVFRYKKFGKRGIMPFVKVSYFNRIDIGIFLLILDLCLDNIGMAYEKTLFPDNGGDSEFTKVCEYKLNIQ